MMTKLPFEIGRQILIKKLAETDSKYGKKPDERTVEELIELGIINLNKPQGPTSHQVSDYVKKVLKIKKAGHSGTLDPNVVGVLPIALNNGTKVLKFLLKAGKEYVCLMKLHKDVDEDKIREVMKGFIGINIQKPPVRSAVKRVERERTVYYLDVLEIDSKNVLFRVGCEAGTYIRTLCVQIGRKLNTGANMYELVRTKVAMFDDTNWITLHDLKDALEFYNQGEDKEIRKIIHPIERAVEHLPKIWVFDTAVDSLCHGADLNVPGIVKFSEGFEKGDMIAVMSLKDELIGIGESLLDYEDVKKKDRGSAVKIKRVVMERGVYPKRDKI